MSQSLGANLAPQPASSHSLKALPEESTRMCEANRSASDVGSPPRTRASCSKAGTFRSRPAGKRKRGRYRRWLASRLQVRCRAIRRDHGESNTDVGLVAAEPAVV